MRLDEQLRCRIEQRLASFEVVAVESGELRTAAVAVALVAEGTGAALEGIATPLGWSDEAAVILTRRPATMRRHASQWALPGGRLEPGEEPEEAALREMAEEVGLQLSRRDVLGKLDDFVTRSGFVITPVVVWAGEAHDLSANVHEVASIHRVPITEFMRADAPLLDPGHDPDQPVLRMPMGSSWVAAPTAAVLYQFREVCLAGRLTRVSHFEQPEFAWR